MWEKILNPAGITLDYEAFETDAIHKIIYETGKYSRKAYELVRAYVERIKLLKRLDDYDAVFVYREAALLGTAFLEKQIAKKKPIIYQLNDPLFVPYKSPSSGYFSYLKFFGKIKEIIRMSKIVVVNFTHIRAYKKQFNKNIWQVSSVGDIAELINENNVGVKVHDFSDKDLMDAYEKKKKLNDISDRCRQSAVDLFDLEKTGGEKYRLTYQKL